MREGFTIIEMIMVVSMVAVIMTFSTPFLSSYMVRNNWIVASDRVWSEIVKAKDMAMSGRVISGSKVWGVCVTSGKVRLFNGSCASPNLSEDYVIPNGVTVSGLTSVTFDNLRGEPSSVTTVSVVSSHGTKTITVGAAGVINTN